MTIEVRVKFDDNLYYEVKKLMYEMRCKTWKEFLRKLVKNRYRLVEKLAD